MNKQPPDKPRFSVFIGGRMAEERREEARQAELQKFIAACEKLYEKHRKE